MTIYNLTGWPSDLYLAGFDAVDVTENQRNYLSNLHSFPKPPSQIELAACARLIAEFCVANLPKGARVLIGCPNYLTHWLEVELCAEGFLPCHPFLKPSDTLGFEVAGIVEVSE